MKAAQIISAMLGDEDWLQRMLAEASVHRPARGQKWIAYFAGASGRQQSKSTGSEDYAVALAIAKQWEAAARAQRALADKTGQPPRPRLRNRTGGAGVGLTQLEVALVLRMSERAVRDIEKRALRKLAQHPQLRALWRGYFGGELSEERYQLSAAEVEALWGLVRTRAELETIRKVLEIVQGR